MDSRGPEINAAILRLIRTRTGSSEEIVVSEFQGNPSFRSLCYELQACDRALKRWIASDSGLSRQRTAEYAQLLGELTEEIRIAISSADRSRTAGGAAAPPA